VASYLAAYALASLTTAPLASSARPPGSCAAELACSISTCAWPVPALPKPTISLPPVDTSALRCSRTGVTLSRLGQARTGCLGLLLYALVDGVRLGHREDRPKEGFVQMNRWIAAGIGLEPCSCRPPRWPARLRRPTRFSWARVPVRVRARGGRLQSLEDGARRQWAVSRCRTRSLGGDFEHFFETSRTVPGGGDNGRTSGDRRGRRHASASGPLRVRPKVVRRGQPYERSVFEGLPCASNSKRTR